MSRIMSGDNLEELKTVFQSRGDYSSVEEVQLNSSSAGDLAHLLKIVFKELLHNFIFL